jgi:hypothetical protein
MLLAAWRKVGFAGGRIDPTLIDRTHFIDRVEVGSPSKGTRSVTKSIDEVVKTPPGMRRGSLAAMQAKLDATVAHIMEQQQVITELTSAGFDPETVPFLMKPKEMEVKEKRDRSQLDMAVYEGGSASLRNVRRTMDGKRAEVEAKRVAVEARKEVAADKKTEAAAAAEKLAADFERCAQGCACDEDPCPMAGMKACGTCRAAGRPWIKPRACVVRECVAARKGAPLLALTYAAGASPPPRLTYTGADDDEAEPADDTDEVMPAAKPLVASNVTLCDWECEQPEMTDEEVVHGYCSGRRCKAKMHPECFLRHAGAAGAALDDVTCFCRGCWAQQ